MVDHILEQIMSPKSEFKIEIKIYRSPHLSTFVKAYMNMYTLVARLYLSTNPSSDRFIKSGIYSTGCGDLRSRRGGRLNGQGHGRRRG